MIKNDGLYDIDNLLLKRKRNQRLLIEAENKDQNETLANLPTSAISTSSNTGNAVVTNNVKTNTSVNRNNVMITGNGVGGLAIAAIFIITSLIAIVSMMSVFVNTKVLTNPLLLGKVEY